MNAMERERRFGLELFPKRDLTIVRGEGAILWDDRGKAYIDCTAGVGVANMGHANPDVAKAIADQARTLVTCPGIFYNDVRARLLELLVSVTPPNLHRAFLCNSGTEAIEAAIKFSRHATGRTEFVCAMRGFHGRTLGALSATFKYRDAFEPLVPGFTFVPFNNLDKLAQAMSDRTAAVMLEPVQGEGGVRPANPGYLAGAQALCREHGALLILDEIQTGFGRTGKTFACEHEGIEPDLLCLAKSLAAGVPMGAVLCGDRVEVAVGIHGTTFGGNPLACAAAEAAINYLQREGLAERSAIMGERFAAAFASQPLARVREVRQLGLMIGIELKEKATPHLIALMEKGVLALPAGPTVIRLLPPLTISEAELDQVVAALHEVLA